MKDRLFILILLYRDGSVSSKVFDSKAAALNYNMEIDMHLGADAINLYKSFVEEVKL